MAGHGPGGAGASWGAPSGVPRRVFLARAEDEGRPVTDFLSRRCPELPAAFLKKLLRKGYVRVGSEAAALKTRLRLRQRVRLYLPAGAFLIAPNPNVPYRIVHEDSAMVVVDKPAGVVSEPGIGHKLDTLLNGLVARYGETMDRMGPECDFGMAHRLDRDTSGLLVVARDLSSWRALTRQFRQGMVAKRYLLLVSGRMPDRAGRVDLRVGRVRARGRMRGAVGAAASQRAETSYRVLETFEPCGGATFVEARPKTGRWRQIRLHFSAIGHPVAGDPEHGDDAFNDRIGALAGLDRMFLHAAELRFRHPETNKPWRAESPLPGELERVLDGLRRPRTCRPKRHEL